MGSPSVDDKKEQYSEREAKERFEAALRGAMKTPHKPLSEKPKVKAPKKGKKKPKT
jgi:hypothetical protein